MNTLALVRRSLVYHARSHLGALLGSAVGTAVLVGALVVGDSVRGSLRHMALARLGKTEFALNANGRFFRAALANEVASSLNAPATAVLQLAGTTAGANQVQVIGIDPGFWKFSDGSFTGPGPNEVALNERLAEQLHVKTGDRLLIRVQKPSRLSREAPLTPQDDFAVPLSLTVQAVVPANNLGPFSLRANQIPPFNAFVSREWLAEQLNLPGRANLLLVGHGPGLTDSGLARALRDKWQLADAELEVRDLGNGHGVELRTSRVFLDPPTVQAALAAAPDPERILTYLVNEIRNGTHATPYSMVAAVSGPLLPADMTDSQILVNQWLADDLTAKPGDALSLSYFALAASRHLEERTNQFTVRAVVALENGWADRTLMPEFPGIEKADSTRDWDSSLPIKLDRIRPKDEAYWKQYRGTPKAFITLTAGQQMWTNRFGDLTAIRSLSGTSPDQFSRAVLQRLDPASLGMVFRPVRAQALAASDQAQDFGQLFLGFSFFLIAAALLLMALLFQFGVEQRASEVGTLLALGFTPKRVRRLLLGEGTALAIVGTIIGIPAGIGYARAMLYGLSTLWRSAVGTSALQYYATPATLATGAATGVLVSVLTLWFALRKQARQPARELLADYGEAQQGAPVGKRTGGLWIGWLASAFAMLLIGGTGFQSHGANPEVFFMAGSLLLISGLGFTAAILGALSTAESAQRPTVTAMGLRNASRRRRRSLATVGLLACGSFLIAAIGVFKLDTNEALRHRSSGTGGFTLVAEYALPIIHDIETPEGRQFFGLNDADLTGVRVVSLRLHDGEDASCLNLNRAQQPRLLGVTPERLADRHAFTFTDVAKGLNRDQGWLLLNHQEPDGAVPAVGDAASIQWALGKKVGDTLAFTDDRGHTFYVRIVGAVANSILQGSLIISERNFLARFPSENGYRMALIDVQPATSAHVEQVRANLARALQDYGVQLTPAARRLAEFNAVQNTYLNTFQVLGGLGLLLGSLGLGVVVLRNVLERRGELALLLAVGLRRRGLRWLVLSEHGALLCLGLALGILSAFVAVLPSLLTRGAEFPLRSLGLTLMAVLASGALWTWAATHLALRGNLLNALRNE